LHIARVRAVAERRCSLVDIQVTAFRARASHRTAPDRVRPTNSRAVRLRTSESKSFSQRSFRMAGIVAESRRANRVHGPRRLVHKRTDSRLPTCKDRWTPRTRFGREPYAAHGRRLYRVGLAFVIIPQNAGPRDGECRPSRLDERAMARRTSRAFTVRVQDELPSRTPRDGVGGARWRSWSLAGWPCRCG